MQHDDERRELPEVKDSMREKDREGVEKCTYEKKKREGERERDEIQD